MYKGVHVFYEMYLFYNFFCFLVPHFTLIDWPLDEFKHDLGVVVIHLLMRLMSILAGWAFELFFF